MFYSIDELDLTILRLKKDAVVLKSIATRTNDKSMLFQALQMEKEIKEMEKGSENSMNLNQFVNYIELTLECPGTIDPYKITASRAFSLYHRAVEKNERLSKLYKHNT
jgi:hypothetical protein